MIITVSTVKDSAPNIRRFVSRNLANGIDHMVVFTEDTGAEAEAFLDEHPSVTHVATGGDWWVDRPDDLNHRQRFNANMARVLLAPFAWAEWLVHIDGDEVALIDRDIVAAFAPGRPTFRMMPLEAVSRETWPEGRVTHFKRLLEPEELTLAKALGLVPQPDNKRYFHGHVRGKVGIRLRTDGRLGLHTVKGGRGRYVTTLPVPGLFHLHYDSATADEYVRKFMTLAASGSSVVYRNSKSGPVNALRTLVGMDLPDDVRARFLQRIYERTTMEDFDSLHDLGFLEEVHPDEGTHLPEAPPADDLQAFEKLVAVAATMSRASFHLDHVEGGYDVLRAALEATGQPVGAAAEILDKMATKVADLEAAAAAEAARAAEEAAGATDTRQPGRRSWLRVPRWRA